MHPSCKSQNLGFYLEINGKQQYRALLSPGQVSTNYPLSTSGLWDIGLLDMNTTFPVMEGIHYLSIQVKSHRHCTNPYCLSPLYQRVPIMIAVVQSSSSNPYLLAVTQCGQCITALPTLEIQLGCGERQHRLSVGLQIADKKPIGHSVKGGNGGDVHMVRPVVARRAR